MYKYKLVFYIVFKISLSSLLLIKWNWKEEVFMKKYILKFKYRFLLICFLILLRQLFLMKSNFLNADAITVLTNRNLHSFFEIILFLSVTWIVIIVIDRVVKVREEIFIQDIGIDVKDNLSSSLIELDIEKYKDNSSGVYQSWFNNDIQMIQEKGLRNIFAIIYSLFGVVFSLYALLKYHWIISLITIIGTGILIYLPKIFNKKLHNMGTEVTKENENYVASLEETILGYDTYFSLNKLQIIPKRIANISRILKNVFVKQSKLESNYYMLNFGLNVFFQVLLVFVTGYLVVKDNLEIGAVAAVGMFANLVFDGMSQVGYRIAFIKGTKPIFSKHDEFMLNNMDTHSSVEYSLRETLFKIKNLHFSYGDKEILNNVNLDIKEGNKYLISGDSGVGKSTLFKIITGQLRNYEGSVEYCNVDLKKLSTKQILEKLTIIQQENFVFSGTVKDNITMGEVAEDSEVAEYLEKVGLTQKDFLYSEVEVHGKNLSGGQRQRLAIARALFNGKKILLIDEGTSALDKESAKSLVEMLLGNKELTIIMISHDISDELRGKFDNIIKL